jgi:hypothetical protein
MRIESSVFTGSSYQQGAPQKSMTLSKIVVVSSPWIRIAATGPAMVVDIVNGSPLNVTSSQGRDHVKPNRLFGNAWEL